MPFRDTAPYGSVNVVTAGEWKPADAWCQSATAVIGHPTLPHVLCRGQRLVWVTARSLLLLPGLDVGQFGTLCHMDTFLVCSETLASCLINIQPLPAYRPTADDNSLIGCTGHDLKWLVVSQYSFRWQPMPFRCLFGCVLLLNQMFWKQCTVRQYHSDLSDKSAVEIRVRIWVRLRVTLF